MDLGIQGPTTSISCLLMLLSTYKDLLHCCLRCYHSTLLSARFTSPWSLGKYGKEIEYRKCTEWPWKPRQLSDSAWRTAQWNNRILKTMEVTEMSGKSMSLSSWNGPGRLRGVFGAVHVLNQSAAVKSWNFCVGVVISASEEGYKLVVVIRLSGYKRQDKRCIGRHLWQSYGRVGRGANSSDQVASRPSPCWIRVLSVSDRGFPRKRTVDSYTVPHS